MLLLQETFGFKWQNESVLSNSEKGKRGEINGKHAPLPITTRAQSSSFGIKKETKNIHSRITVNKRRLCITM